MKNKCTNTTGAQATNPPTRLASHVCEEQWWTMGLGMWEGVVVRGRDARGSPGRLCVYRQATLSLQHAGLFLKRKKKTWRGMDHAHLGWPRHQTVLLADHGRDVQQQSDHDTHPHQGEGEHGVHL